MEAEVSVTWLPLKKQKQRKTQPEKLKLSAIYLIH